jgi:hypothetical protein
LGEPEAYKSVKNLLLNAGFGLAFLLKKIKPTQSAAQTNKQKIASQAKTNLTKNVTAYLKDKGIMASTDVQPAYFDPGIAEKIYATNMDAYTTLKLSSNINDYASWLNVIYSALQAIYAFYYLRATPGETGPEMSDQIRQFMDALSNSANSKENNASVYGE